MYGICLTLWEPHTLPPKQGEKEEGDPVQVHLPKCLVMLSTYPYLVAFREFLTQLNSLSKSGDMTIPMERYICNFCAEIPAPPPGSFEVQTTILDSVICLWSPPHNLPIPWVSLPFRDLFECLDLDHIILVWHALVLERQVLITSTQLSILTIACEIFLSLLFPMKWSHAYIPVLPSFLLPMLSAPMPFLCGLHKASLADALYDLSPECVLVDLDKNTVTLGPETTPLPPIPPVQKSKLRSVLHENAGMVFREARCLTKNDDISQGGANLPAHTKLQAEATWECRLCLFDEAFRLYFTPEEARKNHLNGNDSSGLDHDARDLTNPLSMLPQQQLMQQEQMENRKQSPWDAIQEAFLDTHVYLLRNFRKFLVFPSKHNEGSYGGAGFRSKEFLDSQRYDMRLFLEQLIGTQMFDNFITKRLYGSGEPDVAFFDLAVDRFLKSKGLFADVAIGGRIMKATTTVKSAYDQHRGIKTKKPAVDEAPPLPTPPVNNGNPLLQSAKVHRALKTIVPPEPTGQGLPEAATEASELASAVSEDVDDDNSVHSSSTTTSRESKSSITRKKKSRFGKDEDVVSYKYDAFPGELDAVLFGEPRPLSAVVLAEFERQRSESAQFRRKKQDKGQHIKRAHATTEDLKPPTPEVASFTVFFMAFTALVGKDLVDLNVDPDAPERTILSTYVHVAPEDDSDIEEIDDKEEVDFEEKADVAEMKTSRPSMGEVFGDDSEQAEEASEPNDDRPVEKESTVATEKDAQSTGSVTNGDDPSAITCETETASNGDESSSQPRKRFRDKLSDLEIEEAKATGRAQLALAFEVLTMMKKRALKADPEAYQCLIDACGRVGDTKRATDLLGKMHEDGIVADGTVYACLVSAFSAESAKKGAATKDEDLPEWANSTAVEMDWNRFQKRSLLDRLVNRVIDLSDDEDSEEEEGMTAYQKLRRRMAKSRESKKEIKPKEDKGTEFYVTETVENQIALGENLLEIVFADISVDTEDEICPRCNFELSDDDVATGWNGGNFNDYTTACPNCTQRFVPHFRVQSSADDFMGSKGPGTALFCERLSPWVLQKEIRTVMNDAEGKDNLLNPEWRKKEYKNAVLWWNLVLTCMRFRLPFTFLLQGNFDQNLIAPVPEDDS